MWQLTLVALSASMDAKPFGTTSKKYISFSDRTTKPNINPHPQHPETNIVIAWKSTRHEMMPLTAFNDLMQHIANPMQFIQQST